ncbi:MAG: efflux RND transporter periplasmic adaptor subunit [Oscillospiraceae bacterium]|nr:efflux RND transporter periplasmic adaptor subunit [Oscillospiraceae bacterium]
MQLTKKKIAGIIAVVVVLALLIFSISYVVVANNPHPELAPDAIVTVDRGNLTSTFQTSATVRSGTQGIFTILDGTMVEEVHVRVGQAIEAGDLLATFDASRLDALLQQRRRDYHNARNAYQNYTANAQEAPARQQTIRDQIAALELAILTLQGGGDDTVASGNQQVDDLRNLLTAMLGNGRIANWVVNGMLIREGGIVENVMVSFQNLFSGFMLGGMDLSALGFGGMTEMMNMSLQLMQLRVQETMMNVQAGMSMDSVYRALMESAQTAYQQAHVTVTALREGWYATHDGVVREVNVTAGEVYRSAEGTGAGGLDVTMILASLAMGSADINNMLQGLFGTTVAGMVIEYYPFSASIMLGRYDHLRVEVDQNVRVTSVTGQEFDAYVYYISAVADDGGGFLDGFGLPIPTSRGIPARIRIPEPDLSITIGLDVDIAIELESSENAMRVPVSALRWDDAEQKFFVFVLERGVRSTVRQVFVEEGLFDTTGTTAWREILSGLSEGDEVLRAPPGNLQNGDRVRLA